VNRTDRKNEERALRKSNVKYSISEMREFVLQEVTKMQNEITTRARRYAIRDLSAVFIDKLHLEYGFGKKRIINLFEEINLVFQCLNDGTAKIDEIIKQVEKDLKFDFRMIYQEESEDKKEKIKDK
jgi:hypothetical protein